MATPRRRSSRIQGAVTPVRSNATPLNKLSSLLERDESPAGVQSSLDAIVATPLAPPNTALPQGRFGMPSSTVKTPQTASRIAFEEIHPSKKQQSTTKSVGSFSSHPVNDASQLASSKATVTTVTPTTQKASSKFRPSLPSHMNSPTFDFSFERPECELSVEAQKIMDSVREEAAKIKAQILEERAKQEYEDGETKQLFDTPGRKIAKVKGKTGRFSDAHKEQFKKMDSIASHASTWKNQLQGNITQSLKRSPSKAGLDEATTPKSMTKSKSMRSLHFSTRDPFEISSPSKRARRDYTHDTASTRPVSRDTDQSVQTTPATSRPSSNLPSVAITPTKASLARSASVKNMKSSMIPSLSRTASTMTLGTSNLSMPRTEGSNKYAASLSRFGGSMKSILNRAQPKLSVDNQKVGPGNDRPLPTANFSPQKDLPSLPSSPSKELPPMCQSPTIKRVEASATAASGYPKLTSSPSMSKIPTARATKSSSCQPKHALPSPSKPDTEAPVTYPLLACSPNITTRRPIPRPTTPGDFTFRANKQIAFSPSKNSNSSPAGATTIRLVRASGFPTPMPSSSFEFQPSIPHGMSNKKRKHSFDNDKIDSGVESKENQNKMAHKDEANEDQPLTKKQRLHTSPSSSTSLQAKAKADQQGSPLKRRFGMGVGKTPTKKGAMTLARLSALARPKERK